MHTKLKKTTDDKRITQNFKVFFEKRSMTIKDRKGLQKFLLEKVQYKKEFFKVEKNKGKYYEHGYICWILDNISHYLNTDIALMIEGRLRDFKSYLETELSKLEEGLELNNRTREIVNFSSKLLHSDVMRSVNSSTHRSNIEYKTERLAFFKNVIESKRKKNKEKIEMDYALQEVTNGRDKRMLYYPKSDYDFCFTLDFFANHIKVFLEKNKELYLEELKEISLELEDIHKEMFKSEILPNAIDYNEGEVMMENFEKVG